MAKGCILYWAIVHLDVPRQNNPYDCGYCVIYNVIESGFKVAENFIYTPLATGRMCGEIMNEIFGSFCWRCISILIDPFSNQIMLSAPMRITCDVALLVLVIARMVTFVKAL